MKKLTFLVAGYLFYFIGVSAQSGPKVYGKLNPQTTPEIKALTVGDKVPDIQFENVLNYKSKKARLSDFRGKLVILDMWSVWCTSCIEAFPKMEKLQKEFKDQIQILLVNPHDAKYDSENKIKSTLDKNRIRTGFYPTLPIPIHDSILNVYFPHQSVPHQVWIDRNGKVIAITSSSEVIEDNIQAFLDGKNLSLPIKNDRLKFDKTKPLLVDGNGRDERDFLYRSILTGYQKGLGNANGKTPAGNGKWSRLYVINISLLSLIKSAYPDIFKYRLNRTLIEVVDSTRLQNSIENYYCYEVITPPVPNEEILKYMQDDLFRNFRLRGKKEMRMMECYVLRTNNQIKRSLTQGGSSGADWDENSIEKYIRNSPVSTLTDALHSNVNLINPIVDETGLMENIDIEFPYDFHHYDLNKIKEFLSENGFDLREAKRVMEVAIITDK